MFYCSFYISQTRKHLSPVLTVCKWLRHGSKLALFYVNDHCMAFSQIYLLFTTWFVYLLTFIGIDFWYNITPQKTISDTVPSIKREKQLCFCKNSFTLKIKKKNMCLLYTCKYFDLTCHRIKKANLINNTNLLSNSQLQSSHKTRYLTMVYSPNHLYIFTLQFSI